MNNESKEKFQKPKIIFIDLDGTTIDFKVKKHKRISLKNIEYIEKARQQGIEVVVSTGRPPTKPTQVFLKPLNCLDNFISWNGTVVYQDGKQIFWGKFEKDLVWKIFQDARKYKISVIFNSNVRDRSYTSSWLVSTWLRWTRGKALRYESFKNDFEINKIVLWHPIKSKLHKFANIVKEKYRGMCEYAFTGKYDEVLELTPAGCTKGTAEILFAKGRGVDPADCIHIGDTLNDASAKNRVGKLIAMQNSCDALKKIADYVSPYPSKKNGLAKTIEMLFLDKSKKE